VRAPFLRGTGAPEKPLLAFPYRSREEESAPLLPGESHEKRICWDGYVPLL